METKEQLIKTIKEWVKIDNEIKTLQKELAVRKTTKKTVSTNLMEIMKKNEIDCFDINNGQILYSKKNVKKPITKKVLMGLFSTYFEGDVLKATKLNNYIIENRQQVLQESIVCKMKKKDNISEIMANHMSPNSGIV